MPEVLYQDDQLIAFNKPSGMFSHATDLDRQESQNNNLVDSGSALLNRKLYPIHRLDRASSGILLLALDKDLASQMQSIWSDESTKKYYLCLVRGAHIGPLIFTQPLKKNQKFTQSALSLAHVIKAYQGCSLMEVEIRTGRRHQIRRHFAKFGAHLLGDRTYGKKKINDHYRQQIGLERLFLHAHRLSFIHPVSGLEVKIESKLPEHLSLALERLA